MPYENHATFAIAHKFHRISRFQVEGAKYLHGNGHLVLATDPRCGCAPPAGNFGSVFLYFARHKQRLTRALSACRGRRSEISVRWRSKGHFDPRSVIPLPSRSCSRGLHEIHGRFVAETASMEKVVSIKRTQFILPFVIRRACADGNGTSYDTPDRVGRRVPYERREKRSANYSAAGPQGSHGEVNEDDDSCTQGKSATTWRMHSRLHNDTKEAELCASQSRTCTTNEWNGSHRLHPR